MITLDTATKAFWYGSIILEALLCIRLVTGSYWRRYPWFTTFVAALGIESLILALIRPYNPSLYGYVWIFTRGLALTFEVLAVVEIFSLWARNFPGIESFGRKLFAGLLASSLLAALVTVPSDLMRQGWILVFQATSVANRATHLFLAVFLAMMLAFFALFGGPVAPNLRRHGWSMLGFLSATAITYWWVTVGRAFPLSNILLPAVSFSCFVSWMVAFRRTEEVRVKAEVSPRELAEYHAAEALSQKLLVFGKKVTVRGLLGMKRPERVP